MLRNRYHTTTVGEPFEFAVGNAYADATDQANFDLLFTAGTVGLYAFYRQPETNSKPLFIPAGSALSAANKKQDVFIAFVPATNAPQTVTRMVGSTISAVVVPYVAPVNQVSYIRKASGTVSANHEITVKLVETTPGNQPLPSWSYDGVLSSTETALWTALAAKINAATTEEFFTAAVAALTAPTFGTVTTAGNAVVTAPLSANGSGIFTASLPTGTGTIPLVFTGGGGTGAAGTLNVVNGVATGTTITAAGSGYTTAPVASIAAQTGLLGLTITSTDPARHFKLAVDLQETAANPTSDVVFTKGTITKAQAGNGTLAHVNYLQYEANIRKGIGHYYPEQGTTAADFGLPTDAVASSGTTTFDIVVLTGYVTEHSPVAPQPNGSRASKKKWYLAVPAGQGAAVATIWN